MVLETAGTATPVQYYDHQQGKLENTQESKIKKILAYGCLKQINKDAWICRPIIGYNKRTYTLLRKQDGSFKCNCQGYNKRGHCSHAKALEITLENKGDQKQGVLF